MYSADGGKTWHAATTTINPDNSFVIDTGTGVAVRVSDASVPVTAVYTAAQLNNPDETLKTGEGTWLYVRPPAVYSGDDNNTQVTAHYFNAGANHDLRGAAEGHFTRDTAVRLDSLDIANDRLYYSFTLDNGSNWIQSFVPIPPPGAETARLPVPGGFLNISNVDPGPPSTNNPIAFTPDDMGTQFLIHPHRADIDFQIGDNDFITVNVVGKGIFGGLYNYSENTSYPYSQVVPGPNLFETLGKLIAGLETNDQAMIQQSLTNLDEVMSLVRTRAAEVGGRQNRLTVTQAALTMRTFNELDSLSHIEDVDISELMTRMAQQQIAYTSVLKSSSMVMQMSLVNFL
jgi:flagellar hook-associated protein 3 FlgL